MFTGNRRDIFAVGLAAIIAIGGACLLYFSASNQQAHYQGTAAKYAKQYADRGAEYIKGCARLAPPERPKCKQDAYEAARSGQRYEYDLEAQRVTATWTQHMGIAAMIGMAVSIVGVGLVWTTFAETRASNTINTVALSPRLHIRELCRPGPSGNGDPYRFLVHNDGQTPAIDVKVCGTLKVFQGDEIVEIKKIEEVEMQNIPANSRNEHLMVKVEGGGPQYPEGVSAEVDVYLSCRTMFGTEVKTERCIFRTRNPVINSASGDIMFNVVSRRDVSA